MRMSFKEYLLALDLSSVDEPEVEDFIVDARGDRRLPDVKTLSELRDHMRRGPGTACQEAFDAAEKVWADYEAHSAIS